MSELQEISGLARCAKVCRTKLCFQRPPWVPSRAAATMDHSSMMCRTALDLSWGNLGGLPGFHSAKPTIAFCTL